MKIIKLIIILTTTLCLDLNGQGISIYISPSGSDSNKGTQEYPVATIEKAQQLVRKISINHIRQDTITIFLRKGIYRLKKGIVFSSSDGGTKKYPVVYRSYNNEKVTISGAINIKNVQPLQEQIALNDNYLKNKIVEINLHKTSLSPLELRRFIFTGRNTSRKSYIFRELYINGKPMPLSRWPNNGYTNFLSTTKRLNSNGEEIGLKYKDSHISEWKNYSNILLHGYWRYLWDDDFEYISEIDTSQKIIWLKPPYNYFGFCNSRPFAAFNLPEEIDKEGEWAYDYSKAKLYFYLPKMSMNKTIEFSICEDPLLHFINAQWITIKDIKLEMSAFELIRMSSSSNILIQNCIVHGCASDGIRIIEGHNNTISSCDIFHTGRGAIRVSGGNRQNLKKSGYIIDNCRIHHISRIDRTYTPGVWVDGVGTTISHCEFHDIPSSAMRINGNDHIVEYNEIHHVVTESDDQGAIDMYGDPTYRGNTFKYNYFYDIGPRNKDAINAYCGRAAIRLDDAISGNTVYANIFKNCSNGKMGAVQIHGGKENIIRNNLFYKCKIGVSYNKWDYNKWIRNTRKAVQFLKQHRKLYINRYPELSNLNKNLNINTINNNIFLRCKRITDNNTDAKILKKNVLIKTTKSNNNLENNKYSLKTLSDIINKHNIKPIPFEKIGLRK